MYYRKERNGSCIIELHMNDKIADRENPKNPAAAINL